MDGICRYINHCNIKITQFYMYYSTDTTESTATTQSNERSGGSTITAVSTISPYLKPGASYLGQTSSTRFVLQVGQQVQ